MDAKPALTGSLQDQNQVNGVSSLKVTASTGATLVAASRRKVFKPPSYRIAPCVIGGAIGGPNQRNQCEAGRQNRASLTTLVNPSMVTVLASCQPLNSGSDAGSVGIFATTDKGSNDKARAGKVRNISSAPRSHRNAPRPASGVWSHNLWSFGVQKGDSLPDVSVSGLNS